MNPLYERHGMEYYVNVGYQCFYNANRLGKSIMQRRCWQLSYKLCKENGTTFASK
jgi:hypothetical protein